MGATERLAKVALQPISAPHEKARPSAACGQEVTRFINGEKGTTPNEAIPSLIENVLKLNSTARPIRARTTRNATAAPIVTRPDGNGRLRVRSTPASSLRSRMSL